MSLLVTGIGELVTNGPDGDGPLGIQHDAAAGASELDAFTGQQLVDRRVCLHPLSDADRLNPFDHKLAVVADDHPLVGAR